MKICKVTIRKEYNNGHCQNIYPTGYDAAVMNIIAYDENPLNAGSNVGYCIACVPADFVFTPDMVEITQAESDAFIDAEANKITTVAFDPNTGLQIDLKAKYRERKLMTVPQTTVI